MEFRDILKKLRASRSLTQKELATQLNVTDALISGYGKCKNRIDATLGSVKAAELSPHIIQQWIDDLGKMETLHSQEWRSKNKALGKKYYS